MNDFLSCEEAKKLISPYFDKELSLNENKILENHIEKCPECRQELNNIKQLSSLIRTSYQVNIENHSDKQFSPTGLLPEEIENCLKIKSDISAFIDGELEQENMIETLEHIINCDFCKKQYEKTKKVRELIKDYLQRSTKEDFYLPKRSPQLVVIEKIKTLKQKKKIVTSIAAVVFAALLSWFSFDLQHSKNSNDMNIDKTKFIRSDRPMYVKSEDFIITELYSDPPEEVVSLLYGE